MKQFFTVALTILSLCAQAQTTHDFEGFNLDVDSFLNGEDGSGGFTTGNIFMPNAYNDAWQSWNGWAISNTTDVTTEGFMNQYSSITGGGAEGSASYAVAFPPMAEGRLFLQNEAIGHPVNGFYITNGTYPYLSMLNGDGFAKQFGGPTGDDPDYYLLTIKGFANGEITTDSVDFYLADYRFEDNSMDYIVNEWTYVDLTSLGAVDSLSFQLSSTDNSTFGMNTPGYFCVDNLTTSDGVSSLFEQITPVDFEVFPNPVSTTLQVKVTDNEAFDAQIINMQGQLVFSQKLSTMTNTINVENLPKGTYTLRVIGEDKAGAQLFVKQ